MWKTKPKVGERVACEQIEGVTWPEGTVLIGVITYVDPDDNLFRFMPDEPDPSSNEPRGRDHGSDARTFDAEYGWHVSEEYGDLWHSLENYTIEELPTSLEEAMQ